MILAIDAFAYIPLLATAGVALLLFIFLLIIKKRKSAKISFIVFLSLIILIIGILYTVINPGLMSLALTLFGATFIFIPFCAITITLPAIKESEKKKEDSISQQETPTANSPAYPIIEKLSDDQKDLLDISRDFVLQSYNAFSDRKEGLSKLLSNINKTLIAVTHADGGIILLIDDFEDIISVKSFEGDFPPPFKLPSDLPHKQIRVETYLKYATFPLRDNLFGETALSGKPELITKPELDDRIYQNSPEQFLKCGSYIIVPMKIGDSVIGEIALSRKSGNDAFTDEELDSAVTLSNFAAVTIRNIASVQEVVEHSELTKEADIASNIQQTLVPKKLPSIPNADVSVYNSFTDGVCSDFYDIIPSRKDKISFTITEVVGKGMNSLIIMVMLRAMLKLIVNTKQTADTILTWINHGIASESAMDHFASMALVNYDSTKKSIDFSTGGNTPIWLYSVDKNDLQKISKTSEPVGVEKATTYKQNSLQLKSGDIIVMYTDGLIESLNEKGDQYSFESLKRLIKANHSKSAKEITNIVKSDIKRFNGTAHQHDDQTLLIVKIQ
ncbi:MAG: SpoIIE family protein phosphatase [Treponema sp.]|nr:SpoIIE family protein phosphatase [Treponema sp.]